MIKRGRVLLSSVEIILLVLSVFALGFLLNESQIVSANPGSVESLSAANTPTRASGGLVPSAEVPPTSTTPGGTTAGGTTGQQSPKSQPRTGNSDSSLFGGLSELVSGIFSGSIAGGGVLGALVSGAAYGAVVYGLIKLVAPLLGADSRTADALATAAFAGVFAGQFAFLQLGGSETIIGSASASAFVIGLGVAVAVFALTYKKEKKKIVELQCLPWEAPLGGGDCEKCNNDPIKPCSEYRCRSLGQACELVNPGSTQERCVWVSRNDVNSPIITPYNDKLTTGYRYTNVQGRPPSLGTRIIREDSTNGCVKPFTELQFGVTLNEPAQCKIDFEGNRTFKDMQFYFGESNLYQYNHTQKLRLPSPGSLEVEGPEIPTGGTYNLYLRCQDRNGNVNEDEYVFNFCVDDSPDTTAPIIEETSIISGSPVSFAIQNTSFTAFVNEPAECKWSTQDKDYSLMENTMSCSTHVYQQNARQLYPCTTTLTGIKDRSDNNFYFRCKDQPLKPENERNLNAESFKLVLKGTQTLTITSTGPNQTSTGSTTLVPIDLTAETRNGAAEGKSTCYFSNNGTEGSFVSMFETGGVSHKQRLNLENGNYTYVIRCIDGGGNADSKNVSFNVLTDRQTPTVTRLYKEGPDALKLITSENAECAYSLNSCNFVFEEGVPLRVLSPSARTVHLVEWKTETSYFIKCRDSYDNQPAPDACSVVASATSFI